MSLPALEPLRYNSSNPDGIRATVYDHTVNVYGVDPSTGFAARPLDNYGVQYGLDVLNRGQITTAQFLSLNRDVGGYDADLNHVPQRHRANPTAARRAVDTGRILYGGAGLATTPSDRLSELHRPSRGWGYPHDRPPVLDAGSPSGCQRSC